MSSFEWPILEGSCISGSIAKTLKQVYERGVKVSAPLFATIVGGKYQTFAG